MGVIGGLEGRLRLPVIGAPMFLISTPRLVVAQCTAGIVGSFPALNARPQSQLDEWLDEISSALSEWDRDHADQPAAPFAVNLIVHSSNPRWEADVATFEKWNVPIVISSLGARDDVNHAVHRWGGTTLHDVINNQFASKAIQKGADGLIAVAAGAGGHAGQQSPFALVQEIRTWFDGPLVLSGAIATGRSVVAAQATGADLAYVGSAFIATREANAPERYKRAIVEGSASEIVYTSYFTGIKGNYLRSSIIAAGLDPDSLPDGDPRSTKIDDGETKPWRDIWGSGQGIGVINDVLPAADLVQRLADEYEDARREVLAMLSGRTS